MQATAINTLNVHGSAKNFTVSRSPVPFSSESSGINYLHKATFGGNADGVGIDVKGKIGKITFKRGLGNPNGVYTAKASPTACCLPATIYGTPPGIDRLSRRRASGRHRSAPRASRSSPSGRPTCRSQTAQNPNFVQLGSRDIRLTGQRRLLAHQRGHHHVGVDRQGQCRGTSAQQRNQDRLRLHVVSRRV